MTRTAALPRLPDSPSLSRAEEIALFHQDIDIFLPWSYLKSHLMLGALICCFFLNILFISTIVLSDKIFPQQQQQGGAAARRKICYQLTNFIVNSFLGFLGLYAQWNWLGSSPVSQVTAEESIRNYDHLLFFSSFQVGYQLWAIPVGVLVVGEGSAMLAHHFAVIFVSGLSGLFTNGFRYWTPFFFGFIELSSIPLAVMNAFKDNPGWVQKYPGLHLAVRLTFCIMFIYIRLVLFIPRQWIFLRDLFNLITSTPPGMNGRSIYQVYLTIVIMCSLLLQVLQVFWGALIIKGLGKVVMGVLMGKKKTKGEKQNSDAVANGNVPSSSTEGNKGEVLGNGSSSNLNNGSSKKEE